MIEDWQREEAAKIVEANQAEVERRKQAICKDPALMREVLDQRDRFVARVQSFLLMLNKEPDLSEELLNGMKGLWQDAESQLFRF